MNEKLTGCADADNYIMRLRDAKRSPTTLRIYSFILRGLIRFVGKPSKDITFEDLLRYSNHLANTVTQNVQGCYLSVVLKYIDDMGFLPRNVIKRIQIPKKEKKIPEYLNEYESTKLLTAAQNNPQAYAIIVTFLYCGMRLSELMALNINDINFQEGILIINRGKGNKGRILPLPDPVRAAILKYLEYRTQHNIIPKSPEEKDALFLGRTKKRIKFKTISGILDTYSIKAGIPHVHAHMLRHTCLTKLYRNSRDILAVSRIAGHSNVGITSHYAHITVQELKDTYQKANMIYNTEILSQEPINAQESLKKVIPGYI